MSAVYVYPEHNNTVDYYKNVLLIDRDIRDYEIIASSVNSDTLPIILSRTLVPADLIILLQSRFTHIERIAICNHLIIPAVNCPYLKLITDIVVRFNIKNIDFLACNSLNYIVLSDFYTKLHNDTGVIVGASNDYTGNIKYGGDWVMESTGVNIETIYFTSAIEYYQFLLALPPFTDTNGITYQPDTNSTAYVSAFSQLGKTINKNLIITIPQTISYNSVNYTITSIGRYDTVYDWPIFRGSTDLIKLILPNTIQTIGGLVFHNCINLKTVIFNGEIPLMKDNTFSVDGVMPSRTCYYSATLNTQEKINTLKSFNFFTTYVDLSSAIDDILYSFDDVNLTATITGTISDASSIILANTITKNTVSYTVVAISDNAFRYTTTITKVKIPKTVLSIGYNAFNGCTSLDIIDLSDYDIIPIVNYNSFTNINAANTCIFKITTDITILRYIYKFFTCYIADEHDDIFWYRLQIASHNYTASVLRYYLIDLTRVHIVPYYVTFGNMQFIVDTIDNDCFYNNDGLSGMYSIVLPNTLKYIKNNAFRNTMIHTIYIPRSVESLGEYAFNRCGHLGKIVFNTENMPSIGGNECFKNCGIWVYLPKNVYAVGSDFTTPIGLGGYEINNMTYFDTVDYIATYYNNTTYTNDTNNNILIDGSNVYGYSKSVPNLNDIGVKFLKEFSFANCNTLTNINTITYTTLSIKDYTFYNCSNLVSVNINLGEGIVGKNAFSNCKSLANINLIKFANTTTLISSYAFSYCISLTDISNLLQYTNFIDMYAFSGCIKIKSLNIPNNLITIEAGAFCDCTGLESVSLPNNQYYTNIAPHLFNGCTSLRNITLPANILGINIGTFANCTSLDNITFPVNIDNINQYAFYNCTSLDSITFSGNSIYGINIGAFSNCTSLNNIIFPAYINNINQYAFYNCTSLDSITFSGNIPAIQPDTFLNISNQCVVNYNYGTDIKSLIDLNIFYKFICSYTNNGVNYNLITTRNNAQNAKAADPGSSVVYVYTAVLVSVSDIQPSLVLPSSIMDGQTVFIVTEIGANALADNLTITDVTLPGSIIYLGDEAFSGCTNLSTINFNGDIPSLGVDVFKNISSDNTVYTNFGVDVSTISEIFSQYQIFNPCFLENTQILTNRGYIPIEQIQDTDLIKTLNSGYKKIYKISKAQMIHYMKTFRDKNQLYICKRSQFNVFKDLVITGCHSLLVDKFTDIYQVKSSIEVNGNLFITENKYRLPVCLDNRADIYDVPGCHNIYHIALCDTDIHKNYGIYANGLLVESTSIYSLNK